MSDNMSDQPLARSDDDDDLRELAGYRSEGDQGLGVIDRSELELTGNFNPTDLYQGDTDERPDLQDPAESLDFLLGDNLREGETDDVMEAVEEGLTYVPPIDPPTATSHDSPDEIDVVNGFGLSATDADAVNAELGLASRVMIRLRHDSATNNLSHHIRVRETRRGTIELHGPIDDLTDEDLLIATAEDVEGVEEVISELVLRHGQG